MTSENVAYQAQFKRVFLIDKNVMFCSLDIQFFMF